MKKVIFLLVDSLMPVILEKCFQARSVPALQFLRDKGQYRPDCVTVFPTMTASVDSSLTTGCYPNEHKVPSLIWYDPTQSEIINYINGGKCIWKLGLQKCARNVLIHLNEKHLSRDVKTIFEELAERNLTAASINVIVHRSTQKHKLSLPLPIQISTGIRNEEWISGPEYLTLGAMVYPEFLQTKLHQLSTGPRNLYGINDDFAISASIEIMKSGRQPDFMMIYLPDNDHEVHKVNPEHGENALIKVDQQIQRILNTFESWEEALEKNIFIITSDHGQTRIGKEESFNIDLDQLFAGYSVLQLGENVQEHHQIVICNNERMAYLYPLKKELQEPIIHQLQDESRIDFIAWKDGKSVQVLEGGSKQTFSFTLNHHGEYIDPYQQAWDLEGECSILGIQIQGKNIIYGDYPDALARLYGALFSQDYPMIVINARPRYEFKTKYHPTHNHGGSHGSLHKWDSLIPIIVAGTEQVTIPRRLVEVKDFILSLFENYSPPTT